jgi:hypothetical protein
VQNRTGNVRTEFAGGNGYFTADRLDRNVGNSSHFHRSDNASALALSRLVRLSGFGLALHCSEGLSRKMSFLQTTNKKYGLIKTKPKPAPAASSAPVPSSAGLFGGDDDDVAESTRAAILREQAARAAAAEAAAAALVQESTSDVYDYDGWKATEDEKAAAKRRAEAAAGVASSRSGVQQPAAPAAPRYISGLLEQAKKRQTERDLVRERQIAKRNAEEEAELGGPTERFVTSAYKAQLDERRRREAADAAQAVKEAAEDVTKKGGLGGFYTALVKGVHGSFAGGGDSSGSGGLPSAQHAESAAASSSAAQSGTASGLRAAPATEVAVATAFYDSGSSERRSAGAVGAASAALGPHTDGASPRSHGADLDTACHKGHASGAGVAACGDKRGRPADGGRLADDARDAADAGVCHDVASKRRRFDEAQPVATAAVSSAGMPVGAASPPSSTPSVPSASESTGRSVGTSSTAAAASSTHSKEAMLAAARQAALARAAARKVQAT